MPPGRPNQIARPALSPHSLQQFRMHDSQKVHVYLSITSSPAIEHCSDIRFTAYPDNLKDHHVELNRVRYSLHVATLNSESEQDSKHLSVQDFSHIRATPSPNWSILDNDVIIKSWPEEKTQEKERVQETLFQLLPDINA